jgi:hypothetical protein
VANGERYESPLRDLARKLGAVARDHFAYSQVVELMRHVDDHLCMMAFHEETNRKGSNDDVRNAEGRST